MEIRSQKEFEKAVSFGQKFEGDFWLGASDIQEEGDWVWESNQEEVNRNEFWIRKRPHNRTDVNCLAFLKPRGLFDWHCTARLNSVCEYN